MTSTLNDGQLRDATMLLNVSLQAWPQVWDSAQLACDNHDADYHIHKAIEQLGVQHEHALQALDA